MCNGLVLFRIIYYLRCCRFHDVVLWNKWPSLFADYLIMWNGLTHAMLIRLTLKQLRYFFHKDFFSVSFVGCCKCDYISFFWNWPNTLDPFQIAKTLASASIRHLSDTFALDQCLINIDPRVFAIWIGQPWILLAWCFSTWASATILLIMHPCIISCLSYVWPTLVHDAAHNYQ